MSLKSFVFDLTQKVSSTSGYSLPRSHAYELLAAAFGYKSYAAFMQTSVVLFGCHDTSEINQTILTDRCQQLQCSHVETLINESLHELINQYAALDVTHADLIQQIQRYNLRCSEDDLISSLQEQSGKNGLIHYALGEIFILLVHLEEKPDPYWNRHLKKSKKSGAAETNFSIEYQTYTDRLDQAKQYFTQSTTYGCALGLLGLAIYFENPQFFENPISPEDMPYQTYDPMEIANIAQDMGYQIEYSHWLLDACGHGNTDAIRTAIDDLNDDNPLLSTPLPNCQYFWMTM